MKIVKKYEVETRDVTQTHPVEGAVYGPDWIVYCGKVDTKEWAEHVASELRRDNVLCNRVRAEVRIVEVDVEEFSDEPGYCEACGGRCGWLPPMYNVPTASQEVTA